MNERFTLTVQTTLQLQSQKQELNIKGGWKGKEHKHFEFILLTFHRSPSLNLAKSRSRTWKVLWTDIVQVASLYYQKQSSYNPLQLHMSSHAKVYILKIFCYFIYDWDAMFLWSEVWATAFVKSGVHNGS